MTENNYGVAAVFILALNALLVGTLLHSAATQTPDPQPWVGINDTIDHVMK